MFQLYHFTPNVNDILLKGHGFAGILCSQSLGEHRESWFCLPPKCKRKAKYSWLEWQEHAYLHWLKEILCICNDTKQTVLLLILWSTFFPQMRRARCSTNVKYAYACVMWLSDSVYPTTWLWRHTDTDVTVTSLDDTLRSSFWDVRS